MVKVSVLYPYADAFRFDFDYYCTKHMPMVKDKLGDACQGIAVDRGIAGGAAGSPPSFVAMAHLYFHTEADFQASFGPHTAEIMDDVPNYTDITPVIQISEVLINARRSDPGPFHLHLSSSAN
uniref:EthD family reductase n=2 Tax=Aromatoleum toluolicum TaxID=90060 RepID=A0ABX1NCM4_9RHOO|nr:EthD family reductase [Aromatoleum toluolicum]